MIIHDKRRSNPYPFSACERRGPVILASCRVDADKFMLGTSAADQQLPIRRDDGVGIIMEGVIRLGRIAPDFVAVDQVYSINEGTTCNIRPFGVCGQTGPVVDDGS